MTDRNIPSQTHIPHADWCNSLIIGTRERPVGRCDCGASDQPKTCEASASAPAGPREKALLTSKNESPLKELRYWERVALEGTVARDIAKLAITEIERLRAKFGHIREAVCADYPAAVKLSEIDDIAARALSGDSPSAPTERRPNQQQLLQDYFASHGGSLTLREQRALEDYALWVDDAEPSAPETGKDPSPGSTRQEIFNAGARFAERANQLETALRGLYWDNVDYLTLNKLGGMQNHWMRMAREALGMDIDDVRPSQEETSGNPAMSSSTNIFGTRGACTCGFAGVPPELPCKVHGAPSKHEDPYYVRTFWSPDRKYLVTVHVTVPPGGDCNIIGFQDDNGVEWEPASEQQNMANEPGRDGSAPQANHVNQAGVTIESAGASHVASAQLEPSLTCSKTMGCWLPAGHDGHCD